MNDLNKLLVNEQEDDQNTLSNNKSILELKNLIKTLCEKLSVKVLDFGTINNILRDFSKECSNHPKKLLYSEVTQFVFSNYDNNSGRIEILETNLSTMYEGMVAGEGDKSLYEIAIKLYDHVMLASIQIACINPTKERNYKDDYICVVENYLNAFIKDRIDPELNSLDTKVLQITNETNEVQNKMKKTIQNIQSQIITILSIFTAIVFAFFGGVSFLDGALRGIADCSFYKVSLITIICGFVIFNTVVALLKIISKIIDKNIELPKTVSFVNKTLITLCMIISVCWFIDISIMANWFQSLIYDIFIN